MQARAADPVDLRLGARLKYLRRARGWTQAGLADRVGVSFQQIQKYENGSNQMTVARMRAVATALGVSPNALLVDGPTDWDRLAHLYAGIKDIGKRRAILSYAEALLD